MQSELSALTLSTFKSNGPKVAFFSCSGNGGGREDWELCNLSLIHGLIDKGVQTYLLTDGTESNIYTAQLLKSTSIVKINEALNARLNPKVLFRWLFKFPANIDLMLKIAKQPSHIASYIYNTLRVMAWLNKNNIEALVSINYWSNYAYLVTACKCCGIPAIAIQHGDYYNHQSLQSDRELGPIKGHSHEWPATHIFLFSNESENIYRKKYPFAKSKNYPVGWYPGIRWLLAQPTLITQIVIYESLEFPQMLELTSALMNALGDESIRFRAHPARKTHEWMFKKHVIPPLSSAEGLTRELPSLGISIGSSVSFELMRLRIPVVELFPDDTDCLKDWQFSFSRWPELVHYVSRIINHDETRYLLLKAQADDLPECCAECSSVIRSKYVNKILELVRQD